MHSKLWEREVDTFFIEGFVNSFIGIEINTPIISAIYPYTCHYIHTAGVQRMKSYKGSRFFQDAFISSKNFINVFPPFFFFIYLVYLWC